MNDAELEHVMKVIKYTEKSKTLLDEARELDDFLRQKKDLNNQSMPRKITFWNFWKVINRICIERLIVKQEAVVYCLYTKSHKYDNKVYKHKNALSVKVRMILEKVERSISSLKNNGKRREATLSNVVMDNSLRQILTCYGFNQGSESSEWIRKDSNSKDGLEEVLIILTECIVV